MTIEIRPAVPDDAGAVAALTIELGYDPSGMEGRLGAVLGRSDAAVLVAVVDGEVAGWIHVHEAHFVQVPSFAAVAGLVVADRNRGSGVGERLLEAAEQWARAGGHREIRIRSNAIRERAHRFYLRHGYRIEKTSLTFHKAL
ncbi:MAG: GNAT family N-acetyltransferase [Actinobacteria bacterium]|nr:GNAT family N-acetyltransferase [Actinomycetota bacterium]